MNWSKLAQIAVKTLLRPQSPILASLKVLAAQGQPAAVPLPPELVPGLAQMEARGLLNATVLPLLHGWLLPYWMRRQFDPADPGYHNPGHALALVNASYRNWTAIGLPGSPDEAIVDPCGLVTPWRDGWSLDCWVQPAGGPLLAAVDQPSSYRRQRLQDRLQVVVSAFEAAALQLSTEAWVFRWADLTAQEPDRHTDAVPPQDPGAAWLAVQAASSTVQTIR